MNELSIIPFGDLDQFSRLTKEAKNEYGLWADCITALMSATRATIAEITAKHASLIGCSIAQVRRKWCEWNNGTDQYNAGDWRILVNKRTAGVDWWDTDRAPLPEAFLDFWHGFCGENKRGKCLTQYRKLLRRLARWRRGDLTEAIPGYKTPPPNGANGKHPASWSYRNLMHAANRPRKAEMALHTIGTAAALRELPPVPGTRVGARFLEYIFFDDVWCDRKVIVPGYRQAVRLMQLGGLDYATGVYLHFGQRPELPADDGTRERLKERDTKYLIAAILERYGFPRDYVMHLILERGTATVRPADARALYDLSGGRIVCCYTSMEGTLVVAWDERGSGNSRGKAPIESWHNLFHNESACEPGQIGKDRDHSPADVLGRDREAHFLHDASMLLSPTSPTRLILPYPTAEAAYWQTQAIVDRINARPDHDLEGFEKDVLQWRIKGELEWKQPGHPSLQNLIGRCDDLIEWCPRRESPIERMERLSSGITLDRLPSGILCRFYEDSHVIAKIKGISFEFKRDGKNYRFLPPSIEAALPDGTELCGYYLWPHAEHIHLTRDGAYVATWKRDTKISRGDTDALSKRIAERTAQLNTVMANVRRQRIDDIERREQELQQNFKAIEDAGILPSEPNPHNLARVQVACTPTAVQLQKAVERVKADAGEQQDLAALADAALLKNATVKNHDTEETYD